MSNKPNAENLKQILWDTISEVRDGTTNTQKANAVCSSARTICSIVKLELQMAKLTGKKPTVKAKKFAQIR